MSDINNIQINDVNYAILDEELTDINTEITDVKQDLLQVYVSGTSLIINGGIPNGEDVSY